VVGRCAAHHEKEETMTSPAPIIEFVDISKRFGGVQALDGVTFAVDRGQIHALVGENGAGKSTLIRICGGVYGADTGRIRFDGQDATFPSVEASRDAGISIVHQEIPVCPSLTAAENIFLGRPLPMKGALIDWREANHRAQALFDRLKVKVDPMRRVDTMPIAQQQIVAIAQALSLDSKLLIMDEPTSALNREETRHLFSILKQLKEQGLSIVYVSHKLEEVFEIADCISALRDGKYIGTMPRQDATPDRIVNMMVGREVTNLFPKVQQKRSAEPLLSVRGLCAPGRFEDVTFDLHGGEVLGLVGLQGSGTSDVLRALYGQFQASGGEIRLRGKPVRFRSSDHAISEGVAYVPASRQAEAIFHAMSVRDNSGFLRLRQLAGKVTGWVPARRLESAVGRDVQDFAIRTASIHSSIGSLSGGNQQKVVIARALSTEPQVVLLDDPTRGIDVGAKAEVHHILNRLTGEGKGVILVSSELPEVLAMSDRVIVMYRGQVRGQIEREHVNNEEIMSLATGADVVAREAMPQPRPAEPVAA
jgi:ABC-type sugar transport system ATPase subunit